MSTFRCRCGMYDFDFDGIGDGNEATCPECHRTVMAYTVPRMTDDEGEIQDVTQEYNEIKRVELHDYYAPVREEEMRRGR